MATLDATLPSLELSAESLNIFESATDLVTQVRQVIDDSSYTSSDILPVLNRGLFYIAGKVLLPELERVEIVQTEVGADNILLPSDYMKNFNGWAHSETNNRRITVYKSYAQLYRNFTQIGLAGNVVGVAVRGRRLYYQRIPASAESIRIGYYAYPPQIVVGTEIPTCLPAHLAETLLVNYACREIFAQIEDGMEGAKVNTAYHDARFKEAMAELIAFIGPESTVPEEPVDELWYDDVVNL